MQKLKVLSKTELDHFFREGYVVLKNVYPIDVINKWRNIFKDAFENKLWEIKPYDSPSIINDIYRVFPELENFVFTQKYIDAVKDILGDNIVCVPECAIHKNRFFDWHKDTTMMEGDGETVHKLGNPSLLQCSIYLQDNTPEGGGITLVPRTQRSVDRFVKMHHGNISHRFYYKILKLIHRSPFDLIERYENPIDVPSKAGDLVIFNDQIDHRATFKRAKDGKPLPCPTEKLAIFNTFGQPGALARMYLDNQKSQDIPYAKFLRTTSTATGLRKKALEFGFQIYE
ncbi:MAG: phytanoyl-CoA dioxygenase family protein [Bacteroidetes bacterium]|nr:phytanoyl-CoA dioxygenase family protein [Bacteroidota bacterium]